LFLLLLAGENGENFVWLSTLARPLGLFVGRLRFASLNFVEGAGLENDAIDTISVLICYHAELVESWVLECFVVQVLTLEWGSMATANSVILLRLLLEGSSTQFILLTFLIDFFKAYVKTK